MRKFLGLFLLASFPLALAVADQLIDFRPTGVGTGTTAVVETKVGLTGTPVALSFLGSTNMTFSLSTVDGYGLSLGGAREVVGATATNALNVAITNGVRLSADRLTASFYSAGDSNATAVLRILLED